MAIYLDNHASTPIDPEVLQVLTDAYERFPGNPHAEHNLYGRAAKEAIESATASIAYAFKDYMDYAEVYFTSGATEANNLALIGTVEAYRQRNIDKNRIIISSIEHKSVQEVARVLARKYRMELLEAPVSSVGKVDLQFLDDMIDDRVAIVSIQGTNSEIGTNQDIFFINDICRQRGVVFHSDMTQSAYMESCEEDNEIGLISVSGHKRYAPQGIGALIVNSIDMSEVLSPIMFGGGQQNGIRSGTVPTALVLAFAKAMELGEGGKSSETVMIRNLRDSLVATLADEGIRFILNGESEFKHPGNLSITFNDIDALDFIRRTEEEICISTSSACTSSDGVPSHVLRAIGLSDVEIRRTIRIGVGRFNTRRDIITATKAIVGAINDSL